MAGQAAFSITYGDLKEKDAVMARSLQQGLRRLTVNGQPGDAGLTDTTQINEKYLSDKLRDATDIRGEAKTPKEEAYYERLSQNVGDVANRAKNVLEARRNQFRNNQGALGDRTPNPVTAQQHPLAQQATNDEINQVRGMIKTREGQLDTDGEDIKGKQQELDRLLKERKELTLTVALQPSDTVQNIDDLAFIVKFLSQITATAMKNADILRQQRKLDKDINAKTKEINAKYRTYNTNYRDLGRLDRRLDELGLQAAREQREAEERANEAAEAQEAGVSSSANTADPNANPTPSGAELNNAGTLGNQESAEEAARLAAAANAGNNPTNTAQSNTNHPDTDSASDMDLSEDDDSSYETEFSHEASDSSDLTQHRDSDSDSDNETEHTDSAETGPAASNPDTSPNSNSEDDEQPVPIDDDQIAAPSSAETGPAASNQAAPPSLAPSSDHDTDHDEEQDLSDDDQDEEQDLSDDAAAREVASTRLNLAASGRPAPTPPQPDPMVIQARHSAENGHPAGNPPHGFTSPTPPGSSPTTTRHNEQEDRPSHGMG